MHSRDTFYVSRQRLCYMPTCPDCETETRKRLAIVDPSELKEERDYCLTCGTFVDDDAHPRRNRSGE